MNPRHAIINSEMFYIKRFELVADDYECKCIYDENVFRLYYVNYGYHIPYIEDDTREVCYIFEVMRYNSHKSGSIEFIESIGSKGRVTIYEYTNNDIKKIL